jgi:tetratricopeptide (TPR) repeat protein
MSARLIFVPIVLIVITSLPWLNLSAQDHDAIPASVAETLDLARKALDQGDCRKAVKTLENVDMAYSKHHELLVLKAKAFVQCGEYESASPIIESLRQKVNEVEFTALIWEWDRLHGRSSEVIASMRAMIERMGNEAADVLEIAKVRAMAGQELLQSGQLKEAESEFRAVIGMIDEEHARLHQLDIPHDHARYFSPDAVVGIARITQAGGDKDKAQRLWRSTRNRLSKPEHLVQAGFAALAAGNTKDADRAFENVMKKTTGRLKDANMVIAIAIARDESGAMILEKTQACVARSKDIESQMHHAYALSLNGRHEEAAKTIAQARRLGTKDSRLDCFSALIHAAAGEKDKAIDQFESALAKNPAFDPILAAKAKAFLAENRQKSN